MAFAQSFGTEPLKCNTSCDIGLPLPALIFRGSQAPTQVYVGDSRLAEIRRRNDALAKADAAAQLVGLSRRGWRSAEPTRIIHADEGRMSRLVSISADVVVSIQEVEEDKAMDDELPTSLFKPINYNPSVSLPSEALSDFHPPSKSHAPSCSNSSSPSKSAQPLVSTTSQPAQSCTFMHEESKQRVDSALEFLVEQDPTDISPHLHGLKRYSEFEIEKNTFQFENVDSENEETPLGLPMASPPSRGKVAGYFDF
jgi:hypothetical protein